MTQSRDVRFWLMTLLGLMSAVVVLYYSRTMIHGFVLPRQALLEGIGWAFLLIVALLGLKKADIEIQLSWLHIFYGAYALIGFAGASIALAPEEAMIGALRYAAAFALMVGVSSLFIQPNGTVRNNSLTESERIIQRKKPQTPPTSPVERMMLFVLIISAAISLCALLTISQYYGVDGWWQVASNGVGGSIFGNKNMASDAYSITFLMPLILFWSRQSWMRYAGIAMFLIMSYGLLLTTSKGAFFGMMLGFVFIVILIGYRKWPSFAPKTRLLYVVVPIVLTIAASLYMQQSGRFEGMLSGENDSLRIRLVYWQNSVAAIKEHALLGVGVDNYPLWHNKYSNAIAHTWTLQENFRVTHLHNDYLQAFADQGIPGGITYTLFWAMIVWLGFIAARSPHGAWPIVVAGALMASFGNSLFNFTYHRPTPVLFLGILAGLLVAAAANTRPIKLFSLRPTIMVPFSMAMLAIGLLYNIPYLKADTNAAQGMAYMSVNPATGAQHLEQALKLRPSHQTPINPLIGYYAGKQDFDSLLRILNEHALKYDPYNPYTLRVAAEVQLAGGNHASAWEYLNRIRTFMPLYQAWYDTAFRLAYASNDHVKTVTLALEAAEANMLSDQALLMSINSALNVQDMARYQQFFAIGYERKIPQIVELVEKAAENAVQQQADTPQ